MVNALPGRNAIIMRGVSTGTSEYRTDSQVSVYLDDQPMTSNSQQVDVRAIDIERIESLPGPQGTLFGSSSQTGTLRYITNKPDTTKFGAQLDIEVGTTKGGEPSYDVSGWVNFPVTENIAVRGVGFLREEGGYVDNVLGTDAARRFDNADVVEDDWNDYEVVGGRVAARWQINPNWEATFSLIGQASDSDGAWETDPALGDNKITRFFDEYLDDDWAQVSLNFKGDLGFAELSVTGSYFYRKTDYEWDQAPTTSGARSYYGDLRQRATSTTRASRSARLQLAEAEPFRVRDPPDLARREPLQVAGRRLLRRRLRLVGQRRERPALHATRALVLRALSMPAPAAPSYDVPCPLPETSTTTRTFSIARSSRPRSSAR